MKEKDTAYQRIELASKLESYNETFGANYSEIKKIWKEFFDITLKDIGIKSQKSIDILFWEWDMCNWKAMHKENSEYKDNSRKEMYDSFSGEASYIADRISLDRVFRTHWLFRQIFNDEISEDRYPGSTTFEGFTKYWQ
jgi:hypothetical protein